MKRDDPEASRSVADLAANTPAGSPRHCAFFLDLDGTLVEIARSPRAVHIPSELPALIADLHAAAQGALALVSGRPIADVDRILAMPQIPVAGQHGVERRDARGRLHRHSVDERALAELRRQFPAWRRRYPKLLIEDKGLSIALHFRAAPALEDAIHRLADDALAAMASRDFQVQPGKMVVEIKPAGRDKGSTVDEYMGEAPFAGRLPVFVGDDATDEFGFRRVNARGGVSIKVGEGDTVATRRLENVDAVHRWLRGVLAGGAEAAES